MSHLGAKADTNINDVSYFNELQKKTKTIRDEIYCMSQADNKFLGMIHKDMIQASENVNYLKEELMKYKVQNTELSNKYQEMANKYKRSLHEEVKKRKEIEIELAKFKNKVYDEKKNYALNDYSGYLKIESDYIANPDFSLIHDRSLKELIFKVDELIKYSKNSDSLKCIKSLIKNSQLDKACLSLINYCETLTKHKQKPQNNKIQSKIDNMVTIKPKKDLSLTCLENKTKIDINRDAKSAWPSPAKDEFVGQGSYDDRVLFASPDPFLMVPTSEALKIPKSISKESQIKRVGKQHL